MIYSILVGALIGWIASRLMGGKKGLLRYLILGVAGSAVGNFLAGAIGIAARNSIGPGSNIQENCVVHVEYDLPVVLGRDVTVGHGAILHGCTVGDESLIGMGAIILNGAKIGRHCLIGAGALVTQNMVIPDGSLAFGSPAKIRGTLTDEAIEEIRASAASYRAEAAECRADGDAQEI